MKKLARFFKNSRKNLGPIVSINTLLVVILVAAAYYIGVLRTQLATTKAGAALRSEAAAPAANQAPAVAAAVPAVGDGDYIRGDKNAKVKLIEYIDLECPFCKAFHSTMQQVLSQYSGKVAWVYRHYPLDFHANAQKEGEAAECVGKLGGREKFWQFVDKIFERTTSNGSGFALEKLAPLAVEVGVDGPGFKACLESGEFSQKVKDQRQAGTAAGVTGTPGTFVIAPDGSSQLIPGALAYDQVKQVVESALSKK